MTGEGKSSKKKKRMTLPKKQQDIEKVVKEIEEREGHEHNHHVHGELDEIIAIVELLIDSLNVKMKEVEDKLRLQGNEVTRIYKLLSLLVKYLALDDDEQKKALIKEAESILES